MNRGKRLLHVLVICSAGLASGCFSTEPPAESAAAPAQSLEAAKCITPQEAARLADQVLGLVNFERSEHDLKPVLLNGALQKIAENYACRMVSGAFFGHRDPDTGDGPFERAVAGRYTFYAVGENLSAGPTTPAKVMQLWMQSRGQDAFGRHAYDPADFDLSEDSIRDRYSSYIARYEIPAE